MANKKRYFKLNCLTIMVGNRILRKEWDEVYEEDTFGDSLNELLAQNKIVETNKKGKAVKQTKKEEPEEETETGNEEKTENPQIPQYDDITADEIKEKLKELGVEVDTDDKQELYDKLKEQY